MCRMIFRDFRVCVLPSKLAKDVQNALDMYTINGLFSNALSSKE